MKKKFILLLIAITAFFAAKSQNCDFTHSQIQGTTSVIFNAPVGLPPNSFLFQWTSSSLNQTSWGNTVTFNYGSFPISDVVLLSIYNFIDTTNAICTSVGNVNYGGSNNTCVLSYNQSGPNSYTINSNYVNLNGYSFVWTNSATGTTNFSNEGFLNNVSGGTEVCVSVIQNGNEVCNACITTPSDSSSSSCSFTYSNSPANTLGIIVFTNSLNIATYSWTVNGIAQNIAGPQGAINFPSPGTYAVCLNTLNNNGETCSSCQQITVGNSNTCFIDAQPLGFGTYNLTASQGGQGATYLWNLGNSTFTTTENYLNWQFGNNQDSVNVCVSILNNGVVTCSACTVVFPNAPIPCTFIYSTNPNSNEIVFEMIPPAAGYYMDFGDGTTAFTNDSVIAHVYSQAGSYLVCMNAISASGDTCNYCAYIVVGNVIPPACNANFYAVPSGLTTFFINLSNTSFANSNGSFEWSFGDGSTSTQIHPFHTYQQAGNYQVCLYSIAPNCIDTFCVDLTVTENIPNPLDSCYAYFIVSQTAPFVVDVVNLSAGNNLNFIWSIAGQTATGAFPSFQLNATGSYNLCLQINGTNGCTDTFCDSIIVDSNGMLGKGMQTGFTINVHNPETITNFNPLSTGEIKLKNFGIYPNPFDNFIVLNNPENSKLQYSIISSDGRLLKHGFTGNKVDNIETSELSKGLYILDVMDENGNRKINKIVKR